MKTDEVIEIIKTILSEVVKNETYTVEKETPGGDHDTEQIIISFFEDKEEKRHLFLCGFSTENCLEDKSDWSKDSIEYIELCDGEDSEGGLTHDEGDIVLAYHKIRSYFKKLNFYVVNTIDNHF